MSSETGKVSLKNLFRALNVDLCWNGLIDSCIGNSKWKWFTS